MRLRALEVGVEQHGRHDEVLRDPLGVLLAQRPQLGPDRPVELLAGDPVGDRRLRLARALRREPLTTAALGLRGAGALTSRRRGRTARSRAATAARVALTGCAAVGPAGGPVLRAHDRKP